MPSRRRFAQVDVFTSQPTRGNALAVVIDAEGLDDDQMQTFAAWTNLAETTFILPPDDPSADYKLRIFTPTREMLFAGHPTLGSCAAWLQGGGVARREGLVRQECGVGIVEIDHSAEAPAFVAPPTRIEVLSSQRETDLTERLQLDPSRIVAAAALDNGPQWQVFELASADDVLRVDSSRVRWPDYKAIGLIGPHPPGAECDYEVRMLAPSSGMSEDPITGSLNSALAHWMLSRGTLDRSLVIAQGSCIGRCGRVYVTPDPTVEGRVLIGGHSHILIEGSVVL
jgi:PhzF family phenazine biosynthesis protein